MKKLRNIQIVKRLIHRNERQHDGQTSIENLELVDPGEVDQREVPSADAGVLEPGIDLRGTEEVRQHEGGAGQGAKAEGDDEDHRSGDTGVASQAVAGE